MKAKIATVMVLVSALACGATAGEPTTDTVLKLVENKLQPVIQTLDPKPTLEYREYESSLVVIYLPQTYKIHGRSKTGEVSRDAHDDVGPSFKGFRLRVYLQPKGEVNQACTPQTIREPYWNTDLDVTPIAGTEKQIYWGLSYGGRTDRNLLSRIESALRELAKSPVPRSQ